MADFEQGPTERCTVCQTVYPQCHTCSKYGKRGVHPLDMEKSRNAHDNPSFTDDSGTTQSHWQKKDKKSKSWLHFSSLQISMGSLRLSFSLFSGLTSACIWEKYIILRTICSALQLVPSPPTKLNRIYFAIVSALADLRHEIINMRLYNS